MKRSSLWFACAVLLVSVNMVHAVTTYTLNASGVNDADEPIDFSALLTVDFNTLTIQLTNNTSDPNSAGQTIRSLAFDIAGLSVTPTMQSSSGILRDVFSNAVLGYNDTGPSSTDWVVSAVSSTYLITATGPDQLVIGAPNAALAYADGNASIKNNPHNPHLANSPTFVLSIAGLTPQHTLSNFVFGNGTSAEVLTGIPTTVNIISEIPLPAAAPLGAALLAGLGLIRRRRAA